MSTLMMLSHFAAAALLLLLAPAAAKQPVHILAILADDFGRASLWAKAL